MPWIPYRRSVVERNALSETEARVRKGGQVVIGRAVAESAGLSDRAFVLYDPDSFRLGIRCPEGDEIRDSLRIKPEGDPKSVGQKFVAIDCKGVFKAAGWMAAVEKRPGKKSRQWVRFEGRRPLYARVATADGPAMIIVKLQEGRADEVEDPEEGD